MGRHALCTVGQSPDQIPQQSGLAQPRRGQKKGAAKAALPEQLGQHLRRKPRLLPCDTDGDGGDIPQIGVDPVPQHRRTAHADAEAAPCREIPPAQGIRRRIPGVVRHPVAQLLQLRLSHHRVGPLPCRRHLPSPQQQRQRLPGPQPQLLRLRLLLLRHLTAQPLPSQRQQSRRLLIPPDGVCLVHTLHALSSVMLHYMLVPTQVCRPSYLCIPSICIPLFRLK